MEPSPLPAHAPAPDVPGFRPLAVTDLVGRAGPPDWLWDGYLAAGHMTLLTSPWKSGKTTLAAVLVARMATGGTFAGRPLKPGSAVVLSDESTSLWAERHARLNFGPNVGLLCRPFRGRPTAELWHGLIDRLLRRRAAKGLDLVVIDPVATFLPAGSASALRDALFPLQRLTAAGAAVLVLHHPGRGESAVGLAARGGAVLGGYADVVLELGWFARPPADDRRRKLTAFSRYPETPPRLAIELTADGTDYISLGDFLRREPDAGWQLVCRLLSAATEPLTRAEILARWPDAERRPHEVTLWQWLDRAAADGRVVRLGTGHRDKPYRYRLPPVMGE
jgi:hypothetical protein